MEQDTKLLEPYCKIHGPQFVTDLDCEECYQVSIKMRGIVRRLIDYFMEQNNDNK